MSEDPVKYEPLTDLRQKAQEESLGDGADYERGFIDGMNSVDTVAWPAEQIRIEALRAAASIVASDRVQATRPVDGAAGQLTIGLAKQFEVYVESGE